MTDTTLQTAATHNDQLQYYGKIGRIYKIWLVNLAFNILTLGLYRAWAKTRMRRYLWSHTKVAGDPLHYTGTGGELFRGFIKVALLFIVVSIVLSIALPMLMAKDIPTPTNLTQEEIAQTLTICGYTNENVYTLTQEAYDTCMQEYNPQALASMANTELLKSLLFLPLLMYFIHFARYSALRYRLSRTTWRGIRGRMRGSAHKYVRIALWRDMLNLLTLGVLIPKSDMVKQNYMMQEMYLGNQKAQFVNDASGLMKRNIITLLLSLPTFGFARLWYHAALKNKKLSNLRVGNVTFKGCYTGRGYAWLTFGNLLLILFTLGLATPVALQRIMRFHTNNTMILGDADALNTLQAPADAGNMGEGFAEEFDTGLDLDFGVI